MGNILNAFGPDNQEDEIITPTKEKKPKVKHNNPYFINSKNKPHDQEFLKNIPELTQELHKGVSQSFQKAPHKKYNFQDDTPEHNIQPDQELHKDVPKEKIHKKHQTSQKTPHKKYNVQDDTSTDNTPEHDKPHDNTPEHHFQKHIVHDKTLEDHNEFNKYIKYKEKYLMIKKI